MSNQVIKQASVIIILSLVIFFLTPFLSLTLSINAALSLGVLIGGTLTILLDSPSKQADTPVSSTVDNQDVSTKTIYVGNLPYRANEAAVRTLFESFGTVTSVRLMRDRNTGKRKGFGFVEIEESASQKAIDALNDSEFQQRTLKVREAKDRNAQDDSDLE